MNVTCIHIFVGLSADFPVGPTDTDPMVYSIWF